MASIRSAEPIIPPEDPKESREGIERVVIVIHSPTQPVTPVPTGGEAPPSGDRESSGRHTGRSARGGRHRQEGRSWLDLVDDVMRSWPLTLRVVVLIFAIATGSTAVVMALGVVGQLALAGLAAGGRQERQRRLRALRTGQDLPKI